MQDRKSHRQDAEEAALEARIRQRAYRIWQEEGCPDNRETEHWDMATELIAIEDNYRDTLKPNPIEDYENNPSTEPVEPLEAVHSQGEFPTLTDQGEETSFPDPALRASAEAPRRGARGPRR